jgi:hypothetical protein
MTPAERKLTAALLRMASDTFGNHGCNDFDLTKVIPDKAERDALVRSYFEWNGDPECYYESDGRQGDYRLMDFMGMDLMASRLENE